MPDNEDNRVLQLQTVQAEPIPQAAVKLPGAILCLATFTCEPPPTRPGAGLSSASSPPGSLETDSSSSPGVGSPFNRSQPPSQPYTLSSSSSLDRTSATFLTVVSSKQAQVYHIPANCTVLARSSKSPTSSHPGQSGTPTHEHHLTGFLPSLHHREREHHQPDPPQLARLLLPASPKDSAGSGGFCLAKVELSESSFSVRSAVVQMRQPDESCLVSFLATGNLVVHSLPHLRQLMDADFVACSSAKIGSSMCMSRQGHCLYQPSASEICKFTISAQYKALVNDMTGLLYVPRDMPEMPRTNFFKSLFGSVASAASSKQSDRDELFGECAAGKGSRGVAKHIGSAAGSASGSGGGANSGGTSQAIERPGGLDKLKSSAIGSMGSEMRVAREGLDERGEKLSEIEDRTLQMMLQSESYSQTAHQLAQKFKDKKWYQF